MKVYVMVKTKDASHAPDAMQRGEICTIKPVRNVMGKRSLDTYMAVLMDLNISCGEEYNKRTFRCVKCQYANMETCDIWKYTQAIWEGGTLFEPPTIKHKRKYYINIQDIVSDETFQLLCKKKKTETEKAAILTNAFNNEQSKTIIRERT